PAATTSRAADKYLPTRGDTFAQMGFDTTAMVGVLVKQTKKHMRFDGAAQLIGVSPVISDLRQEIDRVARTDAKVLITGESGTGKEVVARQLHGRVSRQARQAGGGRRRHDLHGRNRRDDAAHAGAAAQVPRDR